MATYTSVDPRTAKQKIWGMLHDYGNLGYPIAHADKGKGGHRTVSAINATTPPVSHRVEGMTAYQISNKAIYILTSNLTSWSAVTASQSNGLFEVVVHPAGVHGEIQTTYKWTDGKLETFIVFPTQVTASSSGSFFYWQSNLISFKIGYTETPTVVGSVLDTRGGIAWNSMSSLSATSVRGVICGSANSAGGQLTLHAIGTWK